MATYCATNCYDKTLELINGIKNRTNYSLTLYPNFGTNREMTIFVYFVLVKLMELVNGGTFAVAGTLVTFWSDSNLMWSKSAYNNISNIEMPSALIWKPNLILINSVSKGPISLDASSQSTVDYDGKVTTVIPKIFNATCPIDITYFPFDTQTCTLTIGNTDLGRQQSETIFFRPALAEVDIEMLSRGGEFSYIGSKVSTGLQNLSQLNFVLPVVNVTMTFKRNPTYYLVSVAIPCVILLFSSGLIFFLPSDNTIKIAMACSLLMALYVLQQAISRVLPTTPTVPLLATGIMIELGLGCYSVLCAVVTVALRALQPPLCPACVKLIKAVERILFDAPSTTQTNKKTLIDNDHHQDTSNAADLTLVSPLNNARSDRLANSITTLVKTLNAQAERSEAKKIEQAEHLRHWKVLDLTLNLVMFLIYFVACVVTCLTYLFGIGI